MEVGREGWVNEGILKGRGAGEITERRKSDGWLDRSIGYLLNGWIPRGTGYLDKY